MFYTHIPHAYTCAQAYDRGGYHVPALLTHGAGASLHTLGKRGGRMPSLYVWQAHGDGRGALEQGLFVCVNIFMYEHPRCAVQMPRVTRAVVMHHMHNSSACEDVEVCMCASARQWPK